MKQQYLPSLFCLILGGAASGKNVPTNAIADLVLGQQDFVTGSFVTPYSAANLNHPSAVVVDPVSRKVFVADFDGDRVLRYPNVQSLTNGAGAEAVFGQSRFSDGLSGNGELKISSPSGLFLDRKGRLWVADSDNNRVLMYEAAIYRYTQPLADASFGQTTFAANLSGTSSSQMSGPRAVIVDSNDNLWVADTGNNRVLRFNSVSTKPALAAVADGVLGQNGFNPKSEVG